MPDPQPPQTSRRNFLQASGLAGAGLLLDANLLAGQAGPAVNGSPGLRISDVRTYVLRTGHTFVEVFTDAGLSGIGECSPMVHGSVFRELIEHAIKPHVVGQSPFDVERLWREVFFGRYKLGPMGVWLDAMAGVDIALWDIMGKALDVPCYMLMGGKVRDRVPLYASAMRHHRSPQDEAAHLQQWVDQGYTAVKIHPYQDWAFNQGDDDTVAVSREVKRVLGDRIDVMVDPNNAYTVDKALQIGRELEQIGCALFEEPIAAYDYAGYARLCEALEIPVAAGEQEYTHWQHKDLIVQGQVDQIQPDVVKCGGLTELRKIGVVASLFNRIIRCHNTQPGVCTAAHYHFWVSDPMCLVHQEYPADHHPLRDDVQILAEPLRIEDGYLTMDDRPGIGVDLNRRVLEELLV